MKKATMSASNGIYDLEERDRIVVDGRDVDALIDDESGVVLHRKDLSERQMRELGERVSKHCRRLNPPGTHLFSRKAMRNGEGSFAARIHGDAMAPEFTEGEIVVFSESSQFRDGDACFVRLADGRTAFRQVFREQDGYRLHPLNSRHGDLMLAADELSDVRPAIAKYVLLAERQ